MSASGSQWEVLLSTPADVGDFGLHQDADVAAAAFRRQFADAFAGSPVADHGVAAEKQFRDARDLLTGQAVLWSGFLMLATPAGVGVAVDDVVDPAAAQDPEDHERLRTLAAVPAMFVILLSVRVRPLPPPPPGPMSQQAALARALSVKYGEDAGVHRVSYGDVSGVATVRTVDHAVAGTSVGPYSFTPDSPPLEHLLAEVSLLFPGEEALVTVTAGVTHGAALQHAVLLAGSIASSVRVRRPDTPPADGAPGAGDDDAAPADDEVFDGAVPAGKEVFDGAGPARDGAAVPAGDDDAGPARDAAAVPAGDDDAGPARDGAAHRAGAETASQVAARAAGADSAVPLSVVLPGGDHAASGTTLVGRGPRRAATEADHAVTVADDSVSRTHLLLRLAHGRAWATDLASRNGTLLKRGDGPPTALAPGIETELLAGDVVNLGSAVLTVACRDEGSR